MRQPAPRAAIQERHAPDLSLLIAEREIDGAPTTHPERAVDRPAVLSHAATIVLSIREQTRYTRGS